MRRERLRALLEGLARGDVGPEEILARLDRDPVERLGGFAALDHHRSLRLGHPEAVFCPGKDAEQLTAICHAMARRGDGFLATRASPEQLDRLESEFPEARVSRPGRIAHLRPDEPLEPAVLGRVLIVTAGTADLPVAEEARVTAEALGNPVELRADVGVAALHRVLEGVDELRSAAVTVVVAGMDGALPSVVGGLVASPVIAVPTSAGYGAALGGLAALATMLTSCAPGLTVVNVDNGYGAACAATRINQASGRTPAGSGDPSSGGGGP